MIFKKAFLFLCAITLISHSVFCAIILNDSHSGFEGEETGSSSEYCINGSKNDYASVPTTSIANSIVKSAALYMDSYSRMMIFLNRIEMAEFKKLDYNELAAILSETIKNLDQAEDSYYSLVKLADSTPYNLATIDKLKFFDYDTYLRTNKLNSQIFKDVQNYLSMGDIRGAYRKIHQDVKNIRENLRTIESEVSSNTFPSISLLWRINQNYMDSILFGQYVAEVFNNIK